MLLHRVEEALDWAGLSLAQNYATVCKGFCLYRAPCASSAPVPDIWWNRSKRSVLRILHVSSKCFKHVQNGQSVGKGRLHVNLAFRPLNSVFPKWRNTIMWKKLIWKSSFGTHATDCKAGSNCEFKHKEVDRVNVGREIGYIELGQLVELIQLFYKQGLTMTVATALSRGLCTFRL